MPECFCTWAGQTENLPSQNTAEIQLFSHECDRPAMLLLQAWWNVLQSFGLFPQLEVSWQMHFPSGSPDNGPQTQVWPFAQKALHLASTGRTRAGKSLAKRNKQFYLVFISLWSLSPAYPVLSWPAQVSVPEKQELNFPGSQGSLFLWCCSSSGWPEPTLQFPRV